MASFIYDLFHRLHFFIGLTCLVFFIGVAIGIIVYIVDFGVEIFFLLLMVTFSYSQTPLIRTLRWGGGGREAYTVSVLTKCLY